MKEKEIRALSQWYQSNLRQLPWRQTTDPYAIWISETMLQQTTSVGVLPYYEKFMQLFPTLSDLAKAPLEKVLEAWSGLGYYSRARNLHQCAQKLNELQEFPQTWQELITYPGIGPYTARAISSLAFAQKAGVLDGNVIRILSRYYNLSLPWWKTKDRQTLQSLADKIVAQGTPSVLNQAMMELGATLCRPLSPYCHLCPIARGCQAKKWQSQAELPMKKPKKAKEIWQWNVHLYKNKNKLALIKNDYLPFLKGQWIFPGTAQKKGAAPKKFIIKHNITHHEIFLTVKSSHHLPKKKQNLQWISPKDLKKINPSSLLQKVLNADK